MIPPTTYIYAKILPEDAPTPELLVQVEEQIKSVFVDAGITAYVYSEQLIKAA